ncbi:MAG: NAD(P)H-hydrate epimerase [Planctomycetales bacterium]|nr:NAD(P)H-hydrate epimerase [Planctomycetales bacterium]MBN8627291.1 NAD(P)H-hydrate epimerase [Planctomycetota bacterium]
MPSQLPLNREQSRRIDVLAVEHYGMTGLVLMENAGRGAAEIILKLMVDRLPSARPVVICCGKGNNGGDGFVIARHLDNRGVPVRILLFCDPTKLTGDAAANYEIARRAGLPIEPLFENVDTATIAARLADAACVVDALLGTGAMGEPRIPYDVAIAAINAQPAPVIAVDLPSGLDCDTGSPAKHCVRAKHTITFVAAKSGFLVAAAKPYVGEVHAVDIGVPRKLLDDLTVVT